MAGKSRSPTENQFGIKVSYTGSPGGWIMAATGDVLLYRTEAEANKAIRNLLKNDNYSWNCQLTAERYGK